ncbi:hypothetical protein [Pseudomonas salmasensis]|uniref:hypothetical protein n=1 Tax=Pseudomonas salmasensis TaxID=2745514 RepID=UPI001CED6759|nr:hypothetical protein [Pseudomonas salmasensis]
MPQRIDTLLDPPARIVVVLRAQVGRVDVVGELAGEVALVAVDAPVGALAFDQVSASWVASPRALEQSRYSSCL